MKIIEISKKNDIDFNIKTKLKEKIKEEIREEIINIEEMNLEIKDNKINKEKYIN